MPIKVGVANTYQVIYILVSNIPAHLQMKKSNFGVKLILHSVPATNRISANGGPHRACKSELENIALKSC